ncbi:hypothetical protein ANO11243_016760 [Dothideomycetidae sp. 11243]|nr:hypothetical protein ANO11243_016760 [fungal sp. No.11243]
MGPGRRLFSTTKRDKDRSQTSQPAIEAPPAQVDEFYATTATAEPYQVTSSDRVAFYREHLRGLGFTPSPAGATTTISDSKDSTVENWMSRRSRKRAQRRNEDPRPQANEVPSQSGDSEDDDDDEFSRYRAEVAAAKRGAPLSSTSNRRDQQGASGRADIPARDVDVFRAEVVAAKRGVDVALPARTWQGASDQADISARDLAEYRAGLTDLTRGVPLPSDHSSRRGPLGQADIDARELAEYRAHLLAAKSADATGPMPGSAYMSGDQGYQKREGKTKWSFLGKKKDSQDEVAVIEGRYA